MNEKAESGVASFTNRVLFFLILAITFYALAVPAEAARRSRESLVPSPDKYAALVVHADTGVVLHEKNATKRRYPASLVKMMTLYMTFDALKDGHLSLNQYLPVSSHAAAMPSMNIGLERGDRIKVRDAVFALVVRSANDAAVVLAEAISGSEDKFARRMNDMARKLGMNDSNFRNASGLHDKNQYSTAADLAKLLIALQNDFPKYYHYMSRTSFMRKGKQYRTHNRLLTNYDGVTGGKTGFINASGFNLATSARRKNHNLVAVVMGGKTPRSRDSIMASLLDKSFDKLGAVSGRKVASMSAIPVPKVRPWVDGATAVTISDSKLEKQHEIWSIELGGYKAKSEVIGAVTQAMDKAPEYLALSQVDIVNYKDDEGHDTHWAKFVSLTENQAKSACDLITGSSKKATCKVVGK